ncbi:MAG: hypothetical protein GXO25_07520 [Euryarchaeota archaeon]|nr:hypothetical protein [Euryarchaeota archaeon]
MRRVYREEGLTSFIVYVGILAIVAMISLMIILTFVLKIPMNTEKMEVRFYQNGEPIHNLTCTDIDPNGYAYYDIHKNPQYLDVYVTQNGKPATGVWVTMSGCGITSEASKTDEHGYAHFDLQGVYLNPGINKDYLDFKVSGKIYHLEVIRG